MGSPVSGGEGLFQFRDGRVSLRPGVLKRRSRPEPERGCPRFPSREETAVRRAVEEVTTLLPLRLALSDPRLGVPAKLDLLRGALLRFDTAAQREQTAADVSSWMGVSTEQVRAVLPEVRPSFDELVRSAMLTVGRRFYPDELGEG